MILIQTKIVRPGAKMPRYSTEQSAGADVFACIDKSLVIRPHERVIVGTGLAMWINNPEFAIKLMARSGYASKGLALGNGVGLIDSDYQGELGVILENKTADQEFVINDGDKIAQVTIERVYPGNFCLVDEFVASTARGAGGFGSTGS